MCLRSQIPQVINFHYIIRSHVKSGNLWQQVEDWWRGFLGDGGSECPLTFPRAYFNHIIVFACGHQPKPTNAQSHFGNLKNHFHQNLWQMAFTPLDICVHISIFIRFWLWVFQHSTKKLMRDIHPPFFFVKLVRIEKLESMNKLPFLISLDLTAKLKFMQLSLSSSRSRH